MKLEFWLEFASTYSYPAAMRIEEAAAERGVEVEWRSFLLGPVFAAQGLNDSPFNIYPAKGRYMWRDLERICEADGIPFRRPSAFPRNGLLAARVACRFASERWIPGFVRSVYLANFARDLDISDPAVVSACIESSGADAVAVLREATSDDSKRLLRARLEEASARDLFGAPSFVVGQELFWGYDRLEPALKFAAENA
jgi:2-hydroxychromene-2-carboxylate isomerase